MPTSDDSLQYKELLAEKERLESFLEHVGGGLGLIDPDLRVVWSNKQSEKWLEVNESIIGKLCNEVVTTDPERCKNDCPVRRAFEENQIQTGVYDAILSSGTKKYYQLTATPVKDSYGKVSHVMVLAQDITKRRLIELELEKKTEMLQVENKKVMEVVQQRNTFFASMSHELRTPMTAIIGFSEILMDDKIEPLTPGQRQMMLKVSQSADRMLNILNDLLDLTKLDFGKMTVSPSKFDLAKVINQVVETMQPLVRDKDVKLFASLPDDIPVMRTDEMKLNQIIVNLVSNAIKCTPSGSVQVQVKRHGDKVSIAVIDTGIGIRESDFELIFEEFGQVEGCGCKRGTGLGLAITKRLVKLLGGQITLNSTIGAGSTFTVMLPVLFDDHAQNDENTVAE